MFRNVKLGAGTATLAMLWLGVTTGWANVRHVPADYATIQAAIDASADGDEVLVAPGRYYENVYLNGKNIGLWATNPSVDLPDPLDASAASIIDGSQPADPTRACAVRFAGTELPTCLLDGFTITGGTGVLQSSGYTQGGGVYGGDGGANWVWTQATIRNCTVTGNTARFGDGLSKCGGRIAQCRVIGN
jgi:hypothetical protein